MSSNVLFIVYCIDGFRIDRNRIKVLKTPYIMAEKGLVMSFLKSKGKNTYLKLDNVKDGISDGEVVILMDTIIAKNIFVTENGYLVQKDGAQLIEKSVSKLRIR